jgi:hypothetical protein
MSPVQARTEVPNHQLTAPQKNVVGTEIRAAEIHYPPNSRIFKLALT